MCDLGRGHTSNMDSLGFDITLFGLCVDAMGAVVLARGLLTRPERIADSRFSNGIRLGADPRVVVEQVLDGVRARAGVTLLLIGFALQALGLTQNRPPVADYVVGWVLPTIAVATLASVVLVLLRHRAMRLWWRRHLSVIAGCFAGNTRINNHEVFGRTSRGEQEADLRGLTATQLASFAGALGVWPHPLSFQRDDPRFDEEVDRVFGRRWWDRARPAALAALEPTGLLKPPSAS